MKDEIKKLLLDISESIAGIETHIGSNRNFFKYQENRTVRKAVERELEIIGEAINKILKMDSEIKISKARSIVDMRNRVIHAYDSINDTIVWKIATVDIPLLKAEVDELLAE
jgi:uncharacterized protein with HEPN domain